ncbi:MAG: 3-oxoacyl-ACP synthase [Planctomycetes bacterium RBG_16_64_10]|nr:MAG: 3-oxoacyl-ACP synthase [Planctomycetes bacterium RBG_16_64_10]
MSNDLSSYGVRSPLRSLTGVQVVGTGSFLPDNVIRNEDLAKLGYDADWIIQRTGIRERRHAPPDMATSDMALESARRCIASAAVDPADIDLLLVSTLSPDYLMPSAACIVQDRLGLRCPAADIVAACAGFLYAMVTGMQYVATGCSRLALVIGADCNSRMMNPADKKTYPLFGDGAGAVLLAPGSHTQGLLAYTLGSDGSGRALLYRPMGGSRVPFATNGFDGQPWYVHMDGRPVFKWAVRLLEDTIGEVLAKSKRSIDDVHLWVLHQANMRILDAAVANIGMDRDKVIVHLDRYGNTSAASVPIALDEASRAGRIERGTNIVMSGFGAGLSWGTTVLQW